MRVAASIASAGSGLELVTALLSGRGCWHLQSDDLSAWDTDSDSGVLSREPCPPEVYSCASRFELDGRRLGETA